MQLHVTFNNSNGGRQVSDNVSESSDIIMKVRPLFLCLSYPLPCMHVELCILNRSQTNAKQLCYLYGFTSSKT